ncbi:cadherin domain-containing protein [Synechocystis salina LEGE 06099]|nr:cadherin domain-containing protein [Synechocystis salina LEGE 06099]
MLRQETSKASLTMKRYKAAMDNNFLLKSFMTLALFRCVIPVGDSPDFEAKQSYKITIKSTDNSLTFTKEFTINVIDINEPPSIVSGTEVNVDENIPTTTVIYQVEATDPDTSAPFNTITYSLGGADASAFNIDGTTGEVRFQSSPNFEAKSSYTIDVIATDGGGLFDSKTVTIGINNLDEVPPTITSGNNASAIYERTGAGQVI